MTPRLLLSFCLLGSPLALRSAEHPEFVDPASPGIAPIFRAGQAAVGQVAMKLVGELTAALSQGGPVAAVDFCHLKALPLTTEPLPDLPEVTSVKRTSRKLRNPQNAPDAAEQRALAHIEQLAAAGEETPTFLVQKVAATAGTPAEWRVYRPILVQQICTACHGNPAQQSPELRAILRERYPRDAATGYQTGDFRGLIRASVILTPSNNPASLP
jgi:hypothetical protein